MLCEDNDSEAMSCKYLNGIWCHNNPATPRVVVPAMCDCCPESDESVVYIGQTRADLQGIQNTLPPMVPGRDRPVHFESDGVIVYEPGEEPQDINGYRRDPNNPFRFLPLWPLCNLRCAVGVRLAKCGCINIIMRCNNPAIKHFADRISHSDCERCQQRKEL